MKNNPEESVKIIPSVFYETGKEGDFGWMISQEIYNDAFFIFNDNEDQFLSHMKNPDDSKGTGCLPGGGNAVIRPWQCKTPPRAGGIPTGTITGYKKLDGITAGDKTVKSLIDEAIANIKKTVLKNNFKWVYFSAEKKDGKKLGTGIFNVAVEVKVYIAMRINTLFD